MSTFSSAEVAFLGEETLIEIRPNFKINKLHFIGGVYGPFRPTIATSVPLWLAIFLRRSYKCEIIAPSWLDVNELERRIQAEKNDPLALQPMPHHYSEVARAILNVASDDLQQPDRIRSLLQDLDDIRHHKLRTNLLMKIESSVAYITLPEMSAMEMHAVRPIAVESLNTFARLAQTESTEKTKLTQLQAQKQAQKRAQQVQQQRPQAQAQEAARSGSSTSSSTDVVSQAGARAADEAMAEGEGARRLRRYR